MDPNRDTSLTSPKSANCVLYQRKVVNIFSKINNENKDGAKTCYILSVPPTPWSNFHAVFEKFWPKNKLSLCGWPLSWEIMDPPLFVDRCEVQQTTTCCWLKSSRHVEACYHISLTAMTIYLSATTWNIWTKTGLTIRN